MAQNEAPDDVQRAALQAALVNTGKGDRAAFAALYRMTSAKLFGICIRILPSRQDAEEVLQEVFIGIWDKARQYDPHRAGAMAWLCTVARNRAIDRLRSVRGRGREADLDTVAERIADEGPDAFSQLAFGQDLHRLNACLSQLEERSAWAIRTAFLSGVTHEQLAIRSGMPAGTLKSIIRRGLLRLRRCMEP
ncbi:sigma-70 family RNA polymerase sigma factor [Aureimonas frigidaquae]|uniref:RNA polymerase sigma factor n=1 Tax=Aureimonas frigidaquae TaxID=424757 RepID=A0A0P0Z200_9HYPH|nr:sigma-70 family RNA polymerase sigma factor [Aureimonas frigidaquae]BAT28086.1 RNA polymerase sigma factor [Aureimonas frigidaquae]